MNKLKNHGIRMKKPIFLKKMIIPYDLNDIQTRATQVWNCDEIGFYPNGRWNKVICTYNLFKGEWMWKLQTGEKSLFWCTLLVFNPSDGKCFMPPIIVHQAKKYYQNIHFNIPLECIVHHPPSRYMDIYRWIKAMAQFSNTCGAYPVKNQTLFFGGNDSNFDERTIRHMECQNIQSFVLKSGN